MKIKSFTYTFWKFLYNLGKIKSNTCVIVTHKTCHNKKAKEKNCVSIESQENHFSQYFTPYNALNNSYY